MWIVAPPFVIVDPTIRLQNPAGDLISHFTPGVAEIKGAQAVSPKVEDVVSAHLRVCYAIREGRANSEIHNRLEPTLRALGQDYPSREVRLSEMVVRYVLAGGRVSDVPPEQISDSYDRLTGAQVWRDHIAPALAEFILP